jgi:hypothetical protein
MRRVYRIDAPGRTRVKSFFEHVPRNTARTKSRVGFSALTTLTEPDLISEMNLTPFPGGRRPPIRGKPGCGGPGIGLVCDEYPYNSTLQGDKFNYRAGRVSLQRTLAADGPRQGGYLSSFYRREKVGKTTRREFS